MTNLIDLEKILSPICNEFPAGFDIRLSHPELYHELKDARNNARNLERKNPQNSSRQLLDEWAKVKVLAISILEKNTKDLEVAAWLIEALLRTNSFSGLAVGLKFITQLIEKFVDSVYPSPDEEGLISCFAPVIYLNGFDNEGTLITPIALTPLTENNFFTLWHYQQATEFKSSALCSDSDNPEAIILENIIQSARTSSAKFFKKLLGDICDCIQHYQTLCDVLDKKISDQIIPSSRLRNILEDCLNCVKTFSSYSLAESDIGINPDKVIENNTLELIIPKNTALPKNVTRESVLQTIAEAANFFRNTEPHSPLPYLLEKSLLWGKMDFPALFKELVQDETLRNQIYQLTGVTETIRKNNE